MTRLSLPRRRGASTDSGATRRPDRSTNARDTAARLRRMGRQQWLPLTGTITFGVASVVLTALGPWLLGRATNLVLAGALGRGLDERSTRAEVLADLRTHGHTTEAQTLGTVDFVPGRGIDFDAIGKVLLFAALLYLAAGLCAFVQGWLANLAVQRAIQRLRQDVEAKVFRLPASYFDRHRRGDVLSRVTNDIDNLSQSLQQTLSQLVIPLFSIAGMLAAMFWVSWLLAVISLVTVPLSLLVVTVVSKRSQPFYLEQWKQTGRLNGHIEEMYTGHAVIKAFGREQQAAEVFAADNDLLARTTHEAQARSSTLQPAMTFLSNLNYVLVAVVGGIRIAAGALTVGDVQAFIQYSRQYSQPLIYLASMAGMVQSGLASAERIHELLDAPEQVPDPASPRDLPTPVAGRVAFEDVTFRYHPGRPLIEALSLVAEPGHTVAIVGPTGAGKTTLVNLLLRFYDVDAGRITLDGVDIATLTRARLRSCTGMVLQDTWLFGGTIADNIAYGAPHATRDEIIAAATAAHADRFIRTLPDGYDTVVDDDGTAISVGEKQLLTIARAFLAQPPILVLDEATSSVDTRTEVLIQQATASLRAGRTAFVIAHRLSTIRDADTIIVMERGAIVEQGTHEHLIHANGAYAQLYAAQFTDATAPAP